MRGAGGHCGGRLDENRLENQRKLEREQEFLHRKVDPQARQQEKERVKVVHRGARQKNDQRATTEAAVIVERLKR